MDELIAILEDCRCLLVDMRREMECRGCTDVAIQADFAAEGIADMIDTVNDAVAQSEGMLI